MKPYAEAFYKSKRWQECREAYAKSKGYLCERCKAMGILTPGVIVHHKIHITPDNIDDPTVTLDWSNLLLVCRDCHAIVHKPTKRYKVDELGRIIPIE